MLSAVVIVDKKNGIGKNGTLLCHLKEDLMRFKQITIGHTIVMGRKTFESLPKVLPNRKHIVVSNNKQFYINDDNVVITNDLQAIIDTYKDSKEEVFVIGGGEIFSSTLPYLKKLYITEIDYIFEADVFFPEYEKENYIVELKSDVFTDELNGYKFKYINYIAKHYRSTNIG
jgi:dihydrofolate reductase